MSQIRRLMKSARDAHGVLSVEIARGAGLSHRQIDNLVERGILERSARGVLLVTGCPPTWRQEVMVAVTAAGPAALASHATAALLHGLTDFRPSRIEIVMPRWDRSRQPFIVHESTDLLPEDRAELYGIPTTSAVRTVVDLGASHDWLVEAALEAGIRARLFTLREVARFVKRVQRKGRRGVGVIRPLIEERMHWDGITDSALEDFFRRWWGPRNPQPVPQYCISMPDGTFVCRTDFAFVELRLRVELDSEAHHMDRATFRRDRAIQNQTELLGWMTLRYTWWDLTHRPEEVIAEIEAALRARSVLVG